MLARVFSTYSGDGSDFQSYIGAVDELNIDDDYLRVLMTDPREAARFFSSRLQCSCIPESLGCNHGFANDELPSGDPFYAFKWAYGGALADAMKDPGVTSAVHAHMKVCEQLEGGGLSRLWDSNEKREKITSALVSFGTDCLLEAEGEAAVIVALGVKALELTGDLNFILTPRVNFDHVMRMRWTASASDLQKFATTLIDDPEREATKFFSARNKCKCLKDKYKSCKAEPKKGVCKYCNAVKERGELKVCQGCKLAGYCGRECQVSVIIGSGDLT